MSASSSSLTKRLHISFAPSVPANGPEDLEKALTAHFGKFATVKSVEGLGKLDGVGVPRKFAYISLEGSEAGISRCVSSLSGSIWKGVKVRVGDAKPDFSQRIATENTADPPPPKRKRKRGAVQADDMTLVSPDTAANRPGWKVTEMGRIVRPLRMRPAHPLPPPLVSVVKKTDTGKPKKRRDPDSRARRRTIDPTRWGSVHLKGVFLENAGQMPVHEDVVGSDESSDSADEEEEEEPPEVVPPPARSLTVTQKLPPASIPSPTPPPPSLAPPKSTPLTSTPASPDVDLTSEKTHSLALLQSLFGSRSDADWVGRESVGSDVDEVELLKVGGGGGYVGGEEDGVEYVPMEVDGDDVLPFAGVVEVEEGDEEEEMPPAPQQKAPTQATKLKDLFAAKAPEASFSLLGHLDLDLDLDLELDDELVVPSSTIPAPVPHHQAPEPEPLAPSYISITLDPKEALFFPTSSFAFSRTDHGFYKTQTDAEIRAQWEGEKVGLTQGWKRRWREAGKYLRFLGSLNPATVPMSTMNRDDICVVDRILELRLLPRYTTALGCDPLPLRLVALATSGVYGTSGIDCSLPFGSITTRPLIRPPQHPIHELLKFPNKVDRKFSSKCFINHEPPISFMFSPNMSPSSGANFFAASFSQVARYSE
ncbi:hypothetical protein R3P38DRAFT_3193794 [Favolaschia claudopus]|uniref:RRM domain-containing protein n=1 Tax=Favolaschia claudopus TaxID=2862362 RepID=A0AAW0BFM4_9AGAR